MISGIELGAGKLAAMCLNSVYSIPYPDGLSANQGCS